MSEVETTTATSLSDLESVVAPQAPAQIAAVIREQELDAQGRAYATGRRKDAVIPNLEEYWFQFGPL